MEKADALQKLLITTKENSAIIEFDNEAKILVLRGHSLPENSYYFFIPIFEWTERYLKTLPDKTTLTIAFEYLHTGATKQIFELIRILKKSEANGNSITVNWYHEDDDDDMRDLGKQFSSAFDMPFNFETFES